MRVLLEKNLHRTANVTTDEPNEFSREQQRETPHVSVLRQEYALADEMPPRRRRRLKIPIILFLLTCCSTFWVGVTNWHPVIPVIVALESSWQGSPDWMPLRQMIVRNWDQGLIYMGCLLLFLFTHEMGHFITTLIYRVPATVPIFLPFPLNPIGTLGAVIGMEPNVADRKQIFDIGIAGPLAGLVVAVPMCILGVRQLDLNELGGGQLAFQAPVLLDWLIHWMGIEGYDPSRGIWPQQMNPMLAAGWVGLLVTGLNMMPVGQLDGGHVTYTLFGKRSFLIAEAIIVLAVAYMIYVGTFHLVVMVLLLLLIGTRHPPTRDDRVKLGWFRFALGLASLSIPILCFPARIFILHE
ncbi:MAG TPA: site-2 protease family protein [Pirellulaceae bacterium]|nr:site-2 protease family protein [Pirellulaceae bacterium]HMO92951.1 site-2 protease family protein [Pirellulaceae bacterium]HMP68484.1 site-2 protease family protein [Pirellulaceae bacterium]